jgi:multidrug efflux pump subunit AcrB
MLQMYKTRKNYGESGSCEPEKNAIILQIIKQSDANAVAVRVVVKLLRNWKENIKLPT